MPAPGQSEPQRPAPVQSRVVQQVAGSRPGLRFHGRYQYGEECRKRQRVEEGSRRGTEQGPATLVRDGAVDDVPERRVFPGVETGPAGQLGPRVEVERVARGHDVRRDGGARVEDELEPRRRDGQDVTVELGQQTLSGRAAQTVIDHGHQVDVAAAGGEPTQGQ